jgi:ABC-type glycerol-3-phosphate transport system permease component
VLIAGGIVMVFPFVWMLLTSFKTLPQLLRDPLAFLPSPWTLANYVQAWNAQPGAVHRVPGDADDPSAGDADPVLPADVLAWMG